jgi:hypothetical protein
MFSALGFFALGPALLAGPFVTLPSPQFGGDPTLIALASDPAGLRLHCYSTRCGDEEWRQQLSPSRPETGRANTRRPRLPGASAALPLRAPSTPRQSYASYSNDWRIGTRYSVQALRDRGTQLGLQFGAGYRLAPLQDDGVSATGPVFRGLIDFGQRLGERAWWTQRIQFETGRGERFIRQAIGLDVALWPAWTLETDVIIRHDSSGESGSETAESWMGIRRQF